jgi:hypothetical protein
MGTASMALGKLPFSQRVVKILSIFEKRKRTRPGGSGYAQPRTRSIRSVWRGEQDNALNPLCQGASGLGAFHLPMTGLRRYGAHGADVATSFALASPQR